MVMQAHRQQIKTECEGVQNNQNSISIDPKTWVKLGHFHLLLEEYNKG